MEALRLLEVVAAKTRAEGNCVQEKLALTDKPTGVRLENAGNVCAGTVEAPCKFVSRTI